MTREDIQELIKKIQSNKRYSPDEINTRREAFLKMIESIDKNDKARFTHLFYVLFPFYC